MADHRRTRILIVDDSATVRSLLRSVVCTDSRLEVAGTAANGASALECIETAWPDLILLDVEMPIMDGLVTLRELRRRGHIMPVIMCSSLTQRGAQVTVEALAGGASDYVAKPQGYSDRNAASQALAAELLPKIHALTSQAPPQLQTLLSARTSAAILPAQDRTRAGRMVPATTSSAIPAVLAIGVSTGGPAALDVLLPALPADFPLPVLIVQHMPELFTRFLAERLSPRCRLRVCEAADGVPVLAGAVYIARGNWHMELVAAASAGSPPTLRLSQGPLENHCRPAVDVLFRSAARVYGAGVIAVVLTGMGYDGLNGCRVVRAHGGSVLVQDQASSTVWGMPGAIANAGLAHRILALDAIVPEILRMVNRAGAACESREMRRLAV